RRRRPRARAIPGGACADRRAHHAARSAARHAPGRRSQDRRGSRNVEDAAGLPRHDGLDRGAELLGGVIVMADLPTPDFARNMRLIGYSDQGGRPDGVQIMVERGFAYVGHMFSKGFSVVDVRDPRAPKPANYIAAPPGTWNIHLQVHGDLLLVINA